MVVLLLVSETNVTINRVVGVVCDNDGRMGSEGPSREDVSGPSVYKGTSDHEPLHASKPEEIVR